MGRLRVNSRTILTIIPVRSKKNKIDLNFCKFTEGVVQWGYSGVKTATERVPPESRPARQRMRTHHPASRRTTRLLRRIHPTIEVPHILASDCEGDILCLCGVFSSLALRGSLPFVETMNSSKFFLLTAFCFLFGGTVLIASTFVTDESDIIYGKGVHAFFDRNYEEAITILTEVEKLDSADPRPYYFLGLAHLRQKNSDRADHYLEKAAKLEYSGRAMRDYAVSESLRRIQGEERQRLEKIRAEERVNAQQREQRLAEIRYGGDNAAAREALRQAVPSNRKEDLAALQKIAETFGDNAFGARAIDPAHTSEQIVTASRSGNNPFGGITTREDTLPEIVAIRPVAERANVPARRQENVADSSGASPIRSVQTFAARGFGGTLRALLSNVAEDVVPTVATFEPENGAMDVNVETVKALRITFDVDMDTSDTAWLGAPDTLPQKTGEPKWIDDRTCELPVELESGREYTVRINVPNRLGFRSKEGVPVVPLLYKFSTQ